MSYKQVFTVTLWAPGEITPMTEDEFNGVVRNGLVCSFRERVKMLELLRTEPDRIAYQGANIGKSLEDAMWRTTVSSEAKEVKP